MKIAVRNTFAALAFALMASSAFGQTINTAESKVTFEVGNMLVNTVEGSFTGMTGEVNFNPSKPMEASFNVCIDPATVDTDNEERDDHLRNPDFFEVKKYKTICLVSTGIEVKAGGFYFVGNLTMHGVTKEVKFPFSYADNTITGTLELDRQDYKIGEDTSSMMVSDDVELTIICKLK